MVTTLSTITDQIVVVGAGISGLSTASLLIQQGHSVKVLDSRDRVGGRLQSVDVGETKFDLGATWFWPGEHRVLKLTNDLGLEVFSQWLEGNAIAESGDTPIYRLNGNPMDVPSYRLVAGASELAAGLEKKLPADVVSLSSKVVAIEPTDNGSVVVRTSSEELVASAVVVATPPSVAVPHFLPSELLDERVAAIASQAPVWMGSSAKVVVVYSEPFWRAQGLAGSGMSNVGPLREFHDMSASSGTPGAIFGFAATGDPRLKEADVVAQMVRLFGVEAASPLAVHIADWGQDLNTTATPNSARPRYDLFGASELTSPHWDSRLYFCSTETATERPGHIEGALQAAERTARAIGPR
jgi:monoamine oxidase